MAHWQKLLLGASLVFVASAPLNANPSLVGDADGPQAGVLPDHIEGAPPEIFTEPAASGTEPVAVADPCAKIGGLPEEAEAHISMFYPFPAAKTGKGEESLRADSEGGIMLVDGVQYTLQYIELPKSPALPFSSVQYPMEARLVHKAADGSTAVLSVPVAEGDANVGVEKMLQDGKAKIDPNDFLPSHRALALMERTGLECAGPSERHYILKTPVQVSAAQIKKFEEQF